MTRQVQFLTSASVRGAAVYASGEIATFEDVIAADLIARGRAVAWPPPEPVAEGSSVVVDHNVEVVTDRQAIAAAMEDTVDEVGAEEPAEFPPDSNPAITEMTSEAIAALAATGSPVADLSLAVDGATPDSAVSEVTTVRRRGGRQSRGARA
jgi:hypothetical protein